MSVASIYRGTTPSVTLHVRGLDLSDKAVWPVAIVTMRDTAGGSALDVTRDGLSITKTDGGCDVTARLTQEQTLAFRGDSHVLVQLRARDNDGNAVASPVAEIGVLAIVRDGEI